MGKKGKKIFEQNALPEMQEHEKPEDINERATVSNDTNVQTVRAFLSTSSYVRTLNPYLKTGFERWLGIHHADKLISRLPVSEWEGLYRKYSIYNV